MLFWASPEPSNLGAIGAGEGPAWHDGWLYFTGGDRISRRDRNGKVEVFRQLSGGANGLAFDSEGRLLACESTNRRVTRTERDGPGLKTLFITVGGTLWSVER